MYLPFHLWFLKVCLHFQANGQRFDKANLNQYSENYKND
jgi:hypothetical protein